ncbi:DUF2486 family protein [Paraburkholderia acidicola]|uniref:DUF2486 family protein n=1 Tax=Paraburkholderia acidicola TaxID=1912599 RepID=A0ABV1LS55_9BURK
MSDLDDHSIPLLTDILVPGNPTHARAPQWAPAGHAPFEAGGGFATDSAIGPLSASAAPAAVPDAPVASFVAPPSVAPALVAADLRNSYDSHDAYAYDPEALAERLRGRFASYLTGEGRSVIETRCRDALQEHSTWLVNQITREVALALETELTGWVRDAVRDEMARRGADRH